MGVALLCARWPSQCCERAHYGLVTCLIHTLHTARGTLHVPPRRSTLLQASSFTHHPIHHRRPVRHKGPCHEQRQPILARTGCRGVQHEVGHSPGTYQYARLERQSAHGHAAVPVPPAVRARGAGAGRGCWIRLGCWLRNAWRGVRGPCQTRSVHAGATRAIPANAILWCWRTSLLVSWAGRREVRLLLPASGSQADVLLSKEPLTSTLERHHPAGQNGWIVDRGTAHSGGRA